MIIKIGENFKGIDPNECEELICKYHLNLTTKGSDADDDPYYLTEVVTATDTYTLPAPVDLRDHVLVEQALNGLGIGTFTATPVGDERIEIVSKENKNELKSIKYTIEGKEFCLDFEVCDCVPDLQCDENTRCTYSLHRKFETSNLDQILFKGIDFAGASYPTSQQIQAGFVPIDTAYPAQIAEYLNSLPEAEGGKFEVYYFNNTLYIQARNTKYEPQKVYFETHFECDGEVETQVLETSFKQRECITNCCGFECGQEGQLPCPNGQANGCNDGLEPDLNGVCRKACQPGTAWVDGELVPAGNYGQPADCFGNCVGNLVPTPAGCMHPDENMTICDIELVLKANPNEKLISLQMGSLGTFAPISPILLTSAADSVLEWANSPDTGICPHGVTECVTATISPVPDEPSLLEYRFRIEAVNIDFTTTDKPVNVTTQYCNADGYHSCVEPANCEEVSVPVSCGVGQVFDRNWARCVTVPDSVCATNEERAEKGLAFQCYECPDMTSEQTANFEALITAQTAYITSNVALTSAVLDWFKARALAVDYRAYAITMLVNEGTLPDCMRLCYEVGNAIEEV